MHRQLVGSLTLGLIGNATLEQNGLIARAIARFRQRDEAVRLSLLIRGPRELEELILKDEMQVAVGYFRTAFRCWTTPRCSRSARWPIAARATRWRPAPAAWAGRRGRVGLTWRTYPLPEASFAGLPRRITSEADNMEAAAVLILSGAHLGYLPEAYAAPYVQAGLLRPLNPALFHYDVDITLVAKKRPT